MKKNFLIPVLAAATILLLILINPGGKIRFWVKKSPETLFEEIEELLPVEVPQTEEQALEEEPASFEPEQESILTGEAEKGELEEAEEDIFSLEELDLSLKEGEPLDIQTRIDALLIQGKNLIEAGRFSEAAGIFTQVLKLDPANEEASNYIFLALSNLKRDEEKAALTRQIEILFDKAKLLYEEKDYLEAQKLFEKIIVLDPSHIVALEYAKKIKDKLSGEEAKKREEERKQRLEEKKMAEEAEQKRIAELKRQIPALYKKANSHYSRKGYDKAIALYKEILSVDPYNRHALAMFKTSKQRKLKKEKTISKTLGEIEKKQRLLEVDQASIPAVEAEAVAFKKIEEKRTIEREKKELPEKLKKIALLKEKAQQLVSLDFEDADLRDVIRFLVEQSGVNIVIDETVLKEFADFGRQAQPFTALAPAIPFTSPFQTPAMPGQETQGLGAPTGTPGFSQSPGQTSFSSPTPQTSFMPALPAAISTEQPKEIVSSRVTIYLVNVPLERALDVTLRSKGLAYKVEEDIIWVSTPERLEHENMEIEVFTLKHALGRFKDFQAAPLSVGESGKQGKEKEDDLAPFLFAEKPSSGRKEPGEDLWSLEATLGEEDAAQREGDIRDIIMQFVPQPEGSAVAYYEKVNKLLARNTPANIEMVRKLLESLDISTYQVSIEARILEVTSFQGRDVGISWDKAHYEKEEEDYINKYDLSTDWEEVAFGKIERIIGGLTFKYTRLNEIELEAVLNALVKTKRGNMLSSPSLTCLNNQTANIRIVTNHKYVSRWEYDTAGYDEYTREFWTPVIGDLDEGIVLNVTPHVNDENMTITLVVQPTVNELVEFTQIGEENHPTQLPQTIIRSVETTVSIKNGETLVLGGLMKDEKSINIRKVPILGDIPLIKYLFRHKTEYDTKSNLLIFITATILNSEGQPMKEKMAGPLL